MGGYIRIDKEQVQDARLLDLADELAEVWRLFVVRGEQPGVFQSGEDLSEIENRHALRNALLGALVTLWVYADTHIRADNSLPVTLSGLAPLVGLPVTILAIFPENWLRVREDGYAELPGYCEKNGIRAKDLRRSDNAEKRTHEREQARIRQQRRRGKLKESSHAVTSRKNGRDNHAVTPDTGTGTGTSDHTSTVPVTSGSLASGAGAPRSPDEERRPKLPEAQLASMARRLRAKGRDVATVTSVLAPYGATAEQVASWLNGVTASQAEKTA